MEMLSKWKSLTNSVAKRDDTDKIVVKQHGKNEINGKRIYDKEQACIFFNKPLVKNFLSFIDIPLI